MFNTLLIHAYYTYTVAVAICILCMMEVKGCIRFGRINYYVIQVAI